MWFMCPDFVRVLNYVFFWFIFQIPFDGIFGLKFLISVQLQNGITHVWKLMENRTAKDKNDNGCVSPVYDTDQRDNHVFHSKSDLTMDFSFTTYIYTHTHAHNKMMNWCSTMTITMVVAPMASVFFLYQNTESNWNTTQFWISIYANNFVDF